MHYFIIWHENALRDSLKLGHTIVLLVHSSTAQAQAKRQTGQYIYIYITLSFAFLKGLIDREPLSGKLQEIDENASIIRYGEKGGFTRSIFAPPSFEAISKPQNLRDGTRPDTNVGLTQAPLNDGV